jgi:hypothetical protein
MANATNNFSDILDRLIKEPQQNRIGLEFRIAQDPGGGVDLGAYEGLISDVRICGRICRDVSLYIGWLERRESGAATEPSGATTSESEQPSPDSLFGEFHRWLNGLRGDLRTRPIEDFVWPHEIRERLERLAAISIFPIPADYDVALSFLGAYSENPTVTQILASGGAISTIVLALVFGTVQVMKEASAPACRAQYTELAQKQTEVFERAARLQGRWTPELRASHGDALKSITAASAHCGSMLENVDLIVDYALQKTATVHFGSASSAEKAEEGLSATANARGDGPDRGMPGVKPGT